MTKHAFARLKHHGYKPSGEDWMGAIPEQWNPCSIRSQFFFRNEKNDPIKTDNILSLSIANGVTPYSEEGRGGNKAKSDLSAYKLAYPDDIVLNSMNVVVGAVGRSKYFGAISPVYYALCARNNTVYVPFYERVFHDQSFQRSLIKYGKGILVKKGENDKLNTIRMKISVDDLKVLLLPHPSYKEQKAIADFLDEKTALIDRAIDIKAKQIALLKERKQILVQNAVTKGLDPSVPMKDSGVDWIGQIPAHWEVKRFCNVFTFGKGLGITKDDLQQEGIRCLNYGEIHSSCGFEIIDLNKLKCVDSGYLEANKKSLLSKGDFVFADTSEDLDGSGNFTYINRDEQIFAGYHTVIAFPQISFCSRYMAYFCDASVYRNQIRAKVKGVKVFSITKTILRSTELLFPSDDEQTKICAYLDVETSKINSAVNTELQQIEKLKEYKASLINSAVTGKIKVA